jgi:hypothetical protein
MTNTFESESTEQLLAEADELIRQINSDTIPKSSKKRYR